MGATRMNAASWRLLPTVFGAMLIAPGATFSALAGQDPAPRVPLAKQEGASISGRTIDARTGKPLAGVIILLAEVSRSTLSDGGGNYAHRQLAPGSYNLRVQHIGYEPASVSVGLTDGQSWTRDILLEPLPNKLPAVVVKDRQASVAHRFDDFERRKGWGRGQFVTRRQIEAANAMNLSDLLQGMRGIRSECLGFTCTLRSARAMKGCLPAYFVDGRVSTVFGPTTPVRDIQAVEVYLGPSETPPEFLGPESSCGVIAVWTKSSPH